jgi:hypothetical protein
MAQQGIQGSGVRSEERKTVGSQSTHLSHTPGPWKASGQGGHSVVLCQSKPARNDTRIPSYGYRDSDGHSIAYPFIDDQGCARLDFVCFSHADARLIAAAPELLAACKALLPEGWDDGVMDDIPGIKLARLAIAKAEGRS